MKIFSCKKLWLFLILVLSTFLMLQLVLNMQVRHFTLCRNIMRHVFYNPSKNLDIDEHAMNTSNFNSFIWNRTASQFGSNKKCNPFLIDKLERKNTQLENLVHGGVWFPSLCRPWSTLAIIVPFRNRESHLKSFVLYMHNFLQCQMFAYQIFVIEQFDRSQFNRAKLMNIGFVEAKLRHTFDCYIFHDVDLLPLNRYALYNCSRKGPLHMASAIDKWNFSMPYGRYFGGAISFTGEQFLKINGFSNNFFGYGGEDDEIERRVRFSGQRIQRFARNVGRYHMLMHGVDKGNNDNPQKMYLIRNARKTWKHDGLNSLQYYLIKQETHAYYTKILVNLMQNSSPCTEQPSHDSIIFGSTTTKQLEEKNNIFRKKLH